MVVHAYGQYALCNNMKLLKTKKYHKADITMQ